MKRDFNIIIHQEDLPQHVAESLSDEVAVDTETLGLNLTRDRLCVIQLKDKNSSDVHLVQFSGKKYQAPNLVKVFNNNQITKVYHFARFDIAAVLKFLGVLSTNNYCTKIASVIARTYSQRHGLKELCSELLGITLSKQQQSSYWGADNLTEEQQQYAANDVLHLSALKEKLNQILIREKRFSLAKSCFEFISTRSLLDILGWEHTDIFAHNTNQP